MQQTLAPPRTDARSIPAFATTGVLILAVLVVIAHLAVSFGTEYWLDEVYMLGLARHPLEWGYADQPPLAPLLAWLMDHIAPDSMFALRIPPSLITGATVVVAALIARELGADRRAQLITAIATTGGLWLALVGHYLAPYTLEPLEWGLLFFVLLRWMRTRNDKLLLLLGVVAGIGAETKFQIFLLCGVLILAVLVFGPRELLTRPMLWLGALIAAVLAAPTLIWQATNGWPQLKMGDIVGAEAQFLSGGRPGVTVTMILFAGVAGVYLLVYGLWRMLRTPEHRFLAVTFPVLYVFFIITLGRPYYLTGLYPVLIAAGAVGLQRRREAGNRRWRWAVWPAAVLTLAGTVLMLGISWTITNPPGGATGPRFTSAAAQAYHRMPQAEQARTAVFGESYIVAADLDAFGPRMGLPKAYSGSRGYGFLTPPDDRQDQVLLVGKRPDQLAPFFTQVRPVQSIGGGQTLGTDTFTVWLCSGKKAPWSQIWPKIQTLVVD